MLGLNNDNKPIVGNFPSTGMHGGKIFLRTDTLPKNLPEQVSAHDAEKEDMDEAYEILKEYTEIFSMDLKAVMSAHYYVLKPNAKNPYKRMYTPN